MYTYDLNNLRCTFTFEENAEDLYRSILQTNLLSNLFIDSNDYKSFRFHAYKIQTLEEFINRKANKFTKFTYDDSLIMAKHLGAQLFCLEKNNLSFLWMDIQHVFVINNCFFLYFGNEHIASLKSKSKGYMTFSTPALMSKHNFAAPEFSGIQSLPVLIPHQAPYYSLGALIIYCLFPNIDPKNISKKDMAPIKESKLFWFLLRAIQDDPRKRRLLFV